MAQLYNDTGKFTEIRVGKTEMVKFEGVRSVEFKLHDGNVKTASNLNYIPGVARNILSLGVLMFRWYRYVEWKTLSRFTREID